MPGPYPNPYRWTQPRSPERYRLLHDRAERLRDLHWHRFDGAREVLLLVPGAVGDQARAFVQRERAAADRLWPVVVAFSDAVMRAGGAS